MTTAFYDEKGQLLGAGISDLCASIYPADCDFDLAAYVLDNLGYVELNWIAEDSVRVQFRPRTVSPMAVAAALYALSDHNPVRIAVCARGETIPDRLCRSLGDAIQHILGMIIGEQGVEAPWIISRQISLNSVMKDDCRFSEFLKFWFQCDRCFSPENETAMLHDRFFGRFMIVEPDEDRQLSIVQVGDGFDTYSNSWRSNVAGKTIENQPDYGYGLWARSMFDSVVSDGHPRVDEVDAVIKRPHLRDSVRIRYRRMILPYFDRNLQRERLLSVSYLDNGINLSLKPGLTLPAAGIMRHASGICLQAPADNAGPDNSFHLL